MLTGKEILKLPMGENDANAETIGEYLITLSSTVWYEGESFSGKRPFGNSGWEHEIYIALAENSVIKSKCEVFDDGNGEYKDWYDFDENAGNKLINKAYDELFNMIK